MWKRKEIKKKAKNVVYRNYWTAIVVCFLIALITGEFGTSIVGIWNVNEPIGPNYIIEENENTEISENQNEKEKIFSKENIEKTLNGTQLKLLETIEANLNSAIKSQKYIFKIWDAIELFNINKTHIGIILCTASVIAIIFIVFIADPLIVGGKRYFLKAREGTNTKISTILEVYKKENWFNIAKTMFLRNIYNALWYLTIIGGVIKTYEYKMMPYILAENPTIKTKEAFNLSKQMMKGNKWKTFVLDISFFGWNFLSVLTFGILSILYVNPYNSATLAELYSLLKEEYYKNL